MQRHRYSTSKYLLLFLVTFEPRTVSEHHHYALTPQTSAYAFGKLSAHLRRNFTKEFALVIVVNSNFH